MVTVQSGNVNIRRASTETLTIQSLATSGSSLNISHIMYWTLAVTLLHQLQPIYFGSKVIVFSLIEGRRDEERLGAPCRI